MKTPKNLLYFVAGFCLIVACSKEDFEPQPLNAYLQSSKALNLNASVLNFEWLGSHAGQTSKLVTALTIENHKARITYIPEWISVEDDYSNPVLENNPVINDQKLWIYPVCKNGGEKRCDAIEITDAAGFKLQICVSQCGCNDRLSVTVHTFIEDPPSYMTITFESGYAANESSSVSVRFTPVNPNYGPNINFNADYYVYKNSVLAGSGQWILLNRWENNRTLTMNEVGKAGDKIMVVIGEHY
jgi:hypothetical protein